MTKNTQGQTLPAPVLTVGDPRLRQKARKISSGDPSLSDDIDILFSTLSDFRQRHGFGRAIAAPQIGIQKRLIAINFGDGPIAVLNPIITKKSNDRFDVWDDCMSLPGVSIKVKRHKSISVDYQSATFEPMTLSDLPKDVSELLQHEIDHLDGILFTDRMISTKHVVATEHVD
jgi:peptide deformylase